MPALAIITAVLTSSVWSEPPPRYYVSPTGDDSATGTLEAPFATITRARDAIRDGRDPAQRFSVILRGGTYALDEPLLLEAQDSGVAYEAYPGERPVLSGGRRISGWRSEGDVWVAHVDRGWVFRQLFVDGERRTRARHPDEGYLGTAGPLPNIETATDPKLEARLGFKYRGGDLERWAGLDGVNLYLYHDWGVSMHWVGELDEQARTVRFTAPCNWPVGQWERSGQRYHLENSREFLDAPGEWYLDEGAATVYYLPLAGEDMTEARVVAPVLGRLVELRGDPEREPIRRVAFRGISFQHAAWDRPRNEPTDGQAAHFLSAAIVAVAAEGCVLDRCEITRVGEYGIWLRSGCRGNRIVQSHIHDLGGGGVRIGEAGYPDDPRWATGHNSIDNCFIHDAGHAFPAGVGVWIGHSGRNRITHNEIRDLYYSGVSAGWTWGYGPSAATHNVIERNHVHRLGFGVLSELGAVYTLGPSEGTLIRRNLLHDTWDYRYGSWGIALDEGSAHMRVEENVVYNHAHGLGLHYGTENEIRGNTIANNRVDGLGIGRQEEHTQLRFHGNIVTARQGTLVTNGWADAGIESDGNVYWHTELADMADFAGLSLMDWQERGHGRNSVIADPLFVDWEEGDFSLRDGSPAARLGIPPVDATNTGLYGDPAWVSLPSRTPLRPNTATGSTGQVRNEFSFDFEPDRVGEAPQLANVWGEDDAASIRVTDEAAAAGRQSLKIVDAGHEPAYQPHMVYQPLIGFGRVRVAFDVRLEEGATVVHQWRDWPTGQDFASGPTLRMVAGGDIVANERPVTAMPTGEWVHLELVCGIGRDSDGTCTLRITMPGGRETVVDGLPAGSADFRRLNYIGFISDAEAPCVWYIDNVVLSRE